MSLQFQLWLAFTLIVCWAVPGTLPLSRACSRLPDGPLTAQAVLRTKPVQLTLLIRRVDDPHPYYRRVRINLRPSGVPGSTLTKQLADSLAHHLNVTDIERVVLNDLIMITSDADLLALECDDRLEVFYRGCGPPTRAPTLLSTVDGVRSVSPLAPGTCGAGTQETSFLLLFTIRSGTGATVWESYNTATGNTSTPVYPSVALATDAGQPSLFRSDALDSLDRLRARLKRQEILVVVYDETGAAGLRLTFDIGGPRLYNRHNWFSLAQLTTSWPIPGISARPTFSYFSVEGDTESHRFSRRRFTIGYNNGNCATDSGLLAVFDVADFCDYAKASFTTPPMIAYTNSRDGSWINGIQRGRRLSIFAR